MVTKKDLKKLGFKPVKYTDNIPLYNYYKGDLELLYIHTPDKYSENGIFNLVNIRKDDKFIYHSTGEPILAEIKAVLKINEK